MANKILVANLNISTLKKSEFLEEVKSLLNQKKQTFITTPNSEFLYAALRDHSLRDLFNNADIALADGIAIFWAERYLATPFFAKRYRGRIIEAWIRVITTGARILLTPRYLYKNIPEKITGADVFFDLVKLAAKENKSIFLVNDQLSSAPLTAKILVDKYPSLKIFVSEKNSNDLSLLTDITEAKPDMLFIAYGQPKQEKWINEHMAQLPVTIAMGVGGTFDYAAGKKTSPPSWIRNIGLEWLFRLFTQPRRLPRIYQATWGLVLSLVRYKVFTSYGYRKNVCIVVVNDKNEVLLCENNPNKIAKVGYASKYNLQNEWLLPQGGVKPEENLIDAAHRELKEEVNISSVKYLGTSEFTNQFDWPNAIRMFTKTKRIFRGQIQHALFFKFTGQDQEIKLYQKVFSNWQWVELDLVEKVIAPIRREYTLKLISELREILEKTS